MLVAEVGLVIECVGKIWTTFCTAEKYSHLLQEAERCDDANNQRWSD
jgi:hypothetical protein